MEVCQHSHEEAPLVGRSPPCSEETQSLRPIWLGGAPLALRRHKVYIQQPRWLCAGGCDVLVALLPLFAGALS